MIYIMAKGNYVSGGPETLHQAASMISEMGYDVNIYYVSPHVMEVPERFKKYNVTVANKIEDDIKNVLIIPETLTHLMKKYRRIKKCIWWLSLEFYLKADPIELVKWRIEANKWPKILFPLAFLVLASKKKIHLYRYHFEDNGKYMHAYNCEYARLYLEKRGVSAEHYIYLCGPLNEAFFDCNINKNVDRENIIIYNPKKGIEFTQKLIEFAKNANLNAEFIALKGMTPGQISELMSKAKIYIDFGEFPGPERIPREAVTMGCNIITSRNGSAANDVDIPIPDEMKFEDDESNIPAIVEKIKDMLSHYEKYYPYYDIYREKVRNQVPQFRENARLLIEKI